MTARVPAVVRRWAVLLPVVLLGGCGGERTVMGRVAYNGQPLTEGQVNFIGADGKSASGTIGPDGSYTVVGVSGGEVTVTVVSTKMVGGDPNAKGAAALAIPKKAPEMKSAVPVKYNDPKTSGLKFTIESRSKTLNLDLTD